MLGRSLDARGRGRAPGARARGFSLIEVLLATALLAAGLALAFATLRAASFTVERGESLAERSERIRAVEGFLRRRLMSVQPVGFDVDERSGAQLRFVGGPDRMRFVSDTPGYLGRGGPALHDIEVVRGEEGLRLQVSFATVLAGQTFPDASPRPPEPLADGLERVQFSYRGRDMNGALTGWLESWPVSEQLPVQVRVEVSSERDGPWPTLVVGLVRGEGLVDGFPEIDL